jgi:hypothetical protein
MVRALGVVIALSACGRVGFDASELGGTDARGDASGIDASDASTALFFDPFTRPADTAIGNGWIENTPGTFQIMDNKVTRTISGDWTRNQVHRAPSEDLADIEVSLEFTLTDLAAPDWPQIFVRGEPSTFAGYYIWFENGPSTFGTPIDIARKGAAESWWTGLAQMTAPPAQIGQLYRLRLSAKGQNPVVLDAHYEQFQAGAWSDIVVMHAEDTDPNAIDTGTWGFDGHTGTALGPYVYDNFTATAI